MPPLFTAIAVPFHVPADMLPRVVMFVEPAQVDSAVFSTLFNASVVFRFTVDVPANEPVPFAYNTSPRVYELSPVPPRFTASVPIHEGVKVCVSPVDVTVRPMFVSDDVANVCDAPVWNDEYCAPREVIPPPAPASAPQAN